MRKSKQSITRLNNNFRWQTAKISLSSENVSEYEFLTAKDVLPGNDFLEKAAAIKGFEYSLLDKVLKKQNSLQKNSIKNLTMLLNLIRKKKTKGKNKKVVLYQI